MTRSPALVSGKGRVTVLDWASSHWVVFPWEMRFSPSSRSDGQRCWGLVRESCKGFFEGRFGDRYRVFNGDQSVVLEGEDFLDCIRQPGDFYGTDDPRMVLAQGRIQIGSGNLRGTPDFLGVMLNFTVFGDRVEPLESTA